MRRMFIFLMVIAHLLMPWSSGGTIALNIRFYQIWKATY